MNINKKFFLTLFVITPFVITIFNPTHHHSYVFAELKQAPSSDPTTWDEQNFTDKTMACLASIANTGASDASIDQAHQWMRQLEESSQPFAKKFLTLLKNMMGLLDNNPDQALFEISSIIKTENFGIPADMIFCAAAACYEKGRMRSDEIVLSFAGDCIFGTINEVDNPMSFPTLYRNSESISYPFDLMKPWFYNDDLTILNYEGTLTNAKKTARKQWKFRGSPNYAKIFPASSVELAVLSNNHSLDYLNEGLEETRASFHINNVAIVERNKPYITKVKGVEIVLIGDSAITGENKTITRGITERVIHFIKKYKRPDNIVVVDMHWGSELALSPSKWQKDTARHFISAGADLVVGQHPHVVQGIELYKGKYIVYSLGNFAFGGKRSVRFPETFVFRIRFSIINQITTVIDASIVPCHTTSSKIKASQDSLRNNFQPKPLFGPKADLLVENILKRSKNVKNIRYFNFN